MLSLRQEIPVRQIFTDGWQVYKHLAKLEVYDIVRVCRFAIIAAVQLLSIHSTQVMLILKEAGFDSIALSVSHDDPQYDWLTVWNSKKLNYLPKNECILDDKQNVKYDQIVLHDHSLPMPIQGFFIGWDYRIGMKSMNCSVYPLFGPLAAVVKCIQVQSFNDYKQEVKMHLLFERIGLAPKLFATIQTVDRQSKPHKKLVMLIIDSKSITVKELIYKYLMPSVLKADVKLKALEMILARMTWVIRGASREKLCHNDAHFGNWMLDLSDAQMYVWNMLLSTPSMLIRNLHATVQQFVVDKIGQSALILNCHELISRYMEQMLGLSTLQLIDFGQSYVMSKNDESDDEARLRLIFKGLLYK